VLLAAGRFRTVALTALQAGKRLAQRSGWTLSNLALQRILYLAHMVHLGRYRTPLVAEAFEAWDYGPVVPVLYDRVKGFGASAVRNVFNTVADPQEGSTEVKVLDEALDRLGRAPAAQLVAMTQREGGAWASSYQPSGGGERQIPREAVLHEYRSRFSGK
jgi:uncharacterized phage-associated protein